LPPLSPQLLVFGPRRADMFGTREGALVALKQLVDPKAKKKPALHSNGISIVPSPGGHSAWAVDIVDVGGVSLAVTAVLTNADDIWLLNVAALADMPKMKAVRAELKQDAVVAPGMAGLAKVDSNAQGAVDKFKSGLVAQNVWGDDLSSRTDAVVLGPTIGDITKGKAEIKKLWTKRVKSNTREVVAGELTASATPDGQIAWVTAPVVRFEDNDDPLPLRVFAVFEKDASNWKMIALAESVAIDAPGSGLIYKKTLAPALPKKDEPPPPKKADDTKTKKTKKKKKKPKSDDS
jgi:ketosteroid isomerase-like protein